MRAYRNRNRKRVSGVSASRRSALRNSRTSRGRSIPGGMALNSSPVISRGADNAKNPREKSLKANKNDAMRAQITRSTQFFSSLLELLVSNQPQSPDQRPRNDQTRGVLVLLGFRVRRRTCRPYDRRQQPKVTAKRPAQPSYDRYFRSNMALTARAMMLARTPTMQIPSNIVAIFSLMERFWLLKHEISIGRRMDFGFIERTRTPAPVFEGAREAPIVLPLLLH